MDGSGREGNRKGFIIMMLSWSIAALALLMQVFMVRGVTSLRVTSWQQQEMQARSAAEAGLDTVINFFKITTLDSCFNYQKPSFDAAGAPLDCEIALNAPIFGHISSGKLTLRATLGSAGGDAGGIMIQYKVVNVAAPSAGITKNITVKAFRDFGTPNAKAIAQIGVQITLQRQVAQGLVARERLTIGADADIQGDVTVLGDGINPIGLNSLKLDHRAWVNGRVLLGTLPAGMDYSNINTWLGDRTDTHRIVMGDGSAIMDENPSGLDLAQRIAAISPHPHLVVDADKKTVADVSPDVIRYGYTGTVDMMRASQSPPDTGGMDCSTDLVIPDFGGRTFTTADPEYSAAKNAFCFDSIHTGKNSQLRFNVGGPVTVYVKGSTAIYPQDSVRVEDAAIVKAIDAGGATIVDGVRLEVANTNTATNGVTFINDSQFNGSIYASQSIITFGKFVDINGTVIFGKELKLDRLGSAGMPAFPGVPSRFRVTAFKSWIDRPDPEAN